MKLWWRLSISCFVLSLLGAGCATGQHTNATTSCKKTDSGYFSDWPTNTSPAEVGKRIAKNFVVRKFDFETNPRRKTVIYPEICAWYGSLTVAQLTGDKDLQTRLVRKFDQFLTPEGAARISTNAHVDYRAFGILPLEIYLQTKKNEYLDLGKSFADKQWQNPGPDGVTSEARYWIDDMYMVTALQAQAYRATHDKVYLDRAALAMTSYLDRLQQTNGLFYHGTNAPFYWGRGCGWVAAGMAELLRDLPKDHPRRARVMEGYHKMMEALLKYQGEDGLWRQLIDKPESWPETSSTAMFTFSMVSGVRNGWLDKKTYGPAARKAWLGLVRYIDDGANVREVCAGTDKGTSVEYYMNRPRKVGDLHGQAASLWAASALLRE